MSIAVVSVAVLVAAVVAGLVANRLTRSRVGDQDNGVAITDLAGPALTLAILFLAFVLVESAESFSRAGAAAVAEADVVDHIFELGLYAREPQRQLIAGAVVCYARAIEHHEWSNMDKGRSLIASTWSTRVRSVFAELKADDSTLFEMLVQADKDRSSARRERITEESLDTPAAVSGLTVSALAISLGVFAYAIPRRKNAGQIGTLIAVTLLLSGSLLLIHDLKHPFSGFTAIAPVAIQDAGIDDAEDYFGDYPDKPLPCDDTGQATDLPIR